MSLDYSGDFQIITDKWRFTIHIIPHWRLSYWKVNRVRDLHIGPFIFRLQFRDFRYERKVTSE